MQRAMNVYWKKIIFIGGIVAAAWVIWMALSYLVSLAVFRFSDFSIEDRTVPELTSTQYRYDTQFQNTLKHYQEFAGVYQEEISVPVPGLISTRMGESYSNHMVPQGLCVAGDYLLITAYDKGGEFSRRVNPSVIYILSNKEETRGDFLTTLVLPDINHVGGITFDGSRVWIAKSTTGTCSAISYRLIDQAARSGQESYFLKDYTQEAVCGVTASFITYYNGRLWVGTYRSRVNGMGRLNSYELEREGGKIKFSLKETFTIPAYAQGVAFTEISGRTCMALTSSWGRYQSSKIYLYEVKETEGNYRLSRQNVLDFPPMAEELASDGEHMYFLFESAATSYSTVNYRKCSYPVDRVCGISSQDLFSWADHVLRDAAGKGGEYAHDRLNIQYSYLDTERFFRRLAAGGYC